MSNEVGTTIIKRRSEKSIHRIIANRMTQQVTLMHIKDGLVSFDFSPAVAPEHARYIADALNQEARLLEADKRDLLTIDPNDGENQIADLPIPIHGGGTITYNFNVDTANDAILMAQHFDHPMGLFITDELGSSEAQEIADNLNEAATRLENEMDPGNQSNESLEPNND